jgi:hypothetical protein
MNAIRKGKFEDENGKLVDVTIDQLGNVVESSDLSINPNIYGDLHNKGHVMAGLCHDPDGGHLAGGGVMMDTATAVRDPAFFRWHSFINDLFLQHKRSLKPYTDDELKCGKVMIKDVNVLNDQGRVTDNLVTYMEHTIVTLKNGLDFRKSGDPIKIK